MNEKKIVEMLGVKEAWKVCDTIHRILRSMRASRSVPTGKDARLVQYEVAIKHAMGTKKISWEAGNFLLNDLSERTVQAILRIRATDRDKIKVWLL